ncbi:MAG: hypothetical protein DRI44_06645 [Chlamydiae bacterium]|nr:MAG: hypothetical protein DRI44_06645 [Chlamydiota bacterium]
MNKKFIYIVLLAYVLMISTLFAEKTDTVKHFSTNNLNKILSDGKFFSYAPGHFKFLLPYYWQIIPDKAVQRYKDILRKMYPNKPVQNYVLALQRKALVDFTMPYALVEIETRPMPTVEEVEGEAVSFAPSVRKAFVDLYKSNLFGEIKPMPAVYDPMHQVIVGYCSMFRAKDKQHLTTVTAIYPCRYGYVRFYFTFQQDTEEKYFPVIENIIKSVKFDDGFEYNPSAAKKNNRGFNKTIYTIVIVLAIIWFGFRIFGRRMNK